MKVLTTNPPYRNTTALVRALGREGVEVHVLGFTNPKGVELDGQAFHSKYCAGRHFSRDPRRDMDGFVDDLCEILEREKFDVLLPVSTNTVIPVSKHAERIRPLCPFPFPDYDKVEAAHNKATMIRIAEEAGVGVPRTRLIEPGADLDAMLEDYVFPVILKTRKGGGSNGVFPAATREELAAIVEKLELKPQSDPTGECTDSSSPMLQEYIPGMIYDIPFIAEDGEVLAHVVQYRERMLPVDGGSGMINKTCDFEPARKAAFDLVKATGWTGIGLVEFKLDANGVPRLMELNPKFWGTLDLSIRAGVNFPMLACQQAMGQPVSRPEYRRGLRYRWMIPDGIRTVRASEDRARAAWEFFSPLRASTTSEVWVRDFGPTKFAMDQMLAGRRQKKRSQKAAAAKAAAT
ncbi:MAG: ATP-grasp domain-containing protein [Phycisphaerales bacterium]